MKKVRMRVGAVTGTLMLSWAGALAADGADLAFEAAWVRGMPPGVKMTAGFGRLLNDGEQAIELVTFSSPQFGDVSLHRTELVEGVSRMREVPSLVIAAGEAVELAPGGYHLMLMMPVESLSEGQAVTVEFTDADGQVFRFEVPVERR